MPQAPTPARALPTLARRAFTSSVVASAPKAVPNKDHHIVEYTADAFPLGYGVASTHCGVKKKAGVLDLGVLASTSERPTSAAACLTRNVFKAAPVTVTTELLARGKGRARGFVVNSGCANAVTGKKGLEDAWAMSNTLTDNLPHSEAPADGAGSLVMSTGVIGQHLPIDKITGAIPTLVQNLASSPKAWMDLARSFMTTDTFPKLRARTFTLGGRQVRLAGVDKGAGMIAPNMGPPQPPHATLLGVLATDAAVSPKALQAALTYAVDRSFNSISVDGDMSTNDTIVALANGAAAPDLGEITEDSPDFAVFRDELASFAAELAQLVVRDGEGATKFVTVNVRNAPSFEVANTVARSVANSSLVKTAMYGEDANWGRILCATGYAAVPEGSIDPFKVSVSFIPAATCSDRTPLLLLSKGEPDANIDEARASEILAEEDLEIDIDLGNGDATAQFWTCDFSHEYVTINGDYRS